METHFVACVWSVSSLLHLAVFCPWILPRAAQFRFLGTLSNGIKSLALISLVCLTLSIVEGDRVSWEKPQQVFTIVIVSLFHRLHGDGLLDRASLGLLSLCFLYFFILFYLNSSLGNATSRVIGAQF